MEEKYRVFKESIKNSGLSYPEVYSFLGRDAESLGISKLSDSSKKEYQDFLSRLKESIQLASKEKNRAKKAILLVQKGRLFEDTISYLLSHIGTYSILRNKRTSTNEIDIILKKKVDNSYLSDELHPPRIIIECKNYTDSVSVTYVGKFISLLQVSECSYGIIFAINGISSRGKWSDGEGLCKKIALRDKKYIICFTLEDLERMHQQSFMEIVNTKLDELRLDIKINLGNHELCQDQDFIGAR